MKWLGLALLSLTALPLTWLLVLLALPFARSHDRTNCLPNWLQWLNTIDDPGCDQGMHPPEEHGPNSEPQVFAIYHHFGWWIKTLYWLGWRNQLYGLFAALCARYDGSPIAERTWWKLKIYSVPGYSEITWPLRRVSFGWKVRTLKTAKLGDPIWWVCMPAFWKSREY